MNTLLTNAFAVTLSTVCLVPLCAQTPAGVLFSDDGFLNQDWTASMVLDRNQGQAATFSAIQELAGGNPGSYRFTVHDLGPGPSDMGVAHLKVGAVYDPTIYGPISTFSFSFDVRAFDNGQSQGIWYHALLSQSGTNYYCAAGKLATLNSWVNYTTGNLGASDFRPVTGGDGFPDFSATAAPIQFGFFSYNGIISGMSHTESGIDNWSVTVSPSLVLRIRVSEVEVRWNSLTNATYQVEYRSSLTTNLWTTLTNCVPSGGSETCIYDKVRREEPQRYYRVAVTNCVPGP